MTKKNLILDFDGVVKDTLPVIYNEMAGAGFDKSDYESAMAFLLIYDAWDELLKTVPEINNSIYNINKIIESKRFSEVAIATHFINMKEAVAKVKYLNENVRKMSSIYLIPKVVEKTCFFSLEKIKKSILVDDFTKNLDEWSSKGGHAIKFSLEKKEKCKYDVIDNLSLLIEYDKIGVFNQEQKSKVMLKDMKVNKLGYYTLDK